MPVLQPPNTSENVLVSVPVPQPVQQAPRAPKPPQPPQFKPLRLPPTVFLPYAMPQQQRQQMQRGPVRFSREDDLYHLFNNLRNETWNKAHRAILADALDDAGKPNFAELVRTSLPIHTFGFRWIKHDPSIAGKRMATFATIGQTGSGHWSINVGHHLFDPSLTSSNDTLQAISLSKIFDKSEEQKAKDMLRGLYREGVVLAGSDPQSTAIWNEHKQSQEPTQMAAYRAPAGGMIVRGTYYQGGKMLPKQATEPVRASAEKHAWIDRLIKKRKKKKVPPNILPSEAGAC